MPELTWILFLRIFDAQESRDRVAAEVQGRDFSPSLRAPFRWPDWAAPYDEKSEARTPEGQRLSWKRLELSGRIGGLIAFVNKELLPYPHRFDVLPDGRPNPSASPRQRVIGRIVTAVEWVRVDSETTLKDILDRIDAIHIDHIDDQHCFALSQVYEGLLLKMGEKNSDGGQFLTPREMIRAMVRTIDPKPGETIYDPCCGTGGFLAQFYGWLTHTLSSGVSSTDLERPKHATFYGREKQNLGANGDVLENAALPATLTGDRAERHPDEQFSSFARELADGGRAKVESDLCCAVDFAARPEQARAAMAPHLAEAAAHRAESLRLKEQCSQLRRDKVGDEALVACRELQIRAERAGRDAQAKADAIDAACNDLKAINPRARDERDTRTPALTLDSIEARGRDIALALTQLRASLQSSAGAA